MTHINYNYLEFFKKSGKNYLYMVEKGIYLSFDENLRYKGLETYYNISNQNYVKLEAKALAKLYAMGWIYDK